MLDNRGPDNRGSTVLASVQRELQYTPSYICNRMEGYYSSLCGTGILAGLLHVVSLWWALPRITIGKERRTHWPIPWQLKFNFVVRLVTRLFAVHGVNRSLL